MAAELKRVRSPNYPQIGLAEAIKHIKKVWDKNHKHPASRENVLSAVGYKSYNGASAGVLSALIKYGLLGREGEDYKVSSLGRDIITLGGGSERLSAIQEAANKPLLFNQLITHFDGTIPANDDLIRTYLVRKDFAPNTVPQVIQAFRETFELVEKETQAYSSTDPENGEEENAMAVEVPREVDLAPRAPPMSQAQAPQPVAPLAIQGEQELASGRVKGVRFRLLVSADIGSKELGKIIRALEVQKELLDDDDENDNRSSGVATEH